MVCDMFPETVMIYGYSQAGFHAFSIYFQWLPQEVFGDRDVVDIGVSW